MILLHKKRAFDSVEHTLVFNPTREQGVVENCIEIIKNIYLNGTAIIRLHKDTNEIKIQHALKVSSAKSTGTKWELKYIGSICTT